MTRLAANLAALRTLRMIQTEGRPASAEEQKVLARWSGWGAAANVFDRSPADAQTWARRYGAAREELGRLMSPAEIVAAARTTVNAHYTDAGYVSLIWDALTRLGFTGGRVLEPGCGSGTFLGLAPAGADLVGVEWDPTTAAIAAAMYPNAQILAESFADTRAPEGSFDAVAGNVPYADVVLTDRRHNPGRLSIHNHFIVKALHLTRPGGMVALLTSRYTLDATNPAARREIAGLADLVAAVRLPSGAHRRAAGTEAVTDLLILRRREPDAPARGAAFERSVPVDVNGISVRVNEYFVTYPHAVLGRYTTGGLHRADELTVDGEPDATPALAGALEAIVAEATTAGLTMSPRPNGPAPARPVAAATRGRQPDGYLQSYPDGTFTRVVDGVPQPYQPPPKQAAELRALLRLRDIQVAMLEAEAGSIDDTPEMDRLRAELNRAYDAYVTAYGPVNRYGRRRTGRTHPETGDEILARVYPPQGGFAVDPYAAAVKGLEHFDPERQAVRKADIFRGRVIAPRAPRLGADTSADAFAICLDQYGEIRLGEVARLLGVNEADARDRLGDLVFNEPGTGELVPAPEYLSGNVRTKLNAARLVAAINPRFQSNVAALEQVLPADLGPGEIAARLGASWISAGYVRQFLAEILDDPTIQVEHPYGPVWAVRSQRHGSVLATTKWGNATLPAPEIAKALLEQRPVRVFDDGPNNTRVFSADKTVAAQEKAREMSERFADWVWEDPARSADLRANYNTLFNSLVLRSYDQVPLSLPGLALSFKPRPHQVAAVARVIAEPSVGLWHEVGAGKTAEMAMAAMELRRLGLARKPAIVIPNHMLDQFTAEFHQLYPRAKLLAASSDDLAGAKRREFVARATTGDWDAVIITRGAFERVPMSAIVQEQYLRAEVDRLEAAIVRTGTSGERMAVKRLEKMKMRAEERIRAKLDGAKDPGITFELTGIDYLMIDEAHGYKNLRTPSNVPGMSVDGSSRATDLHLKIEYLRGRSKRAVTFATATPIANTMGEAYTMLRYLRPDLLDAVGVADFDVFAATFGEVVSQVEVAPEGGVRLHSRFAKFINVPELLRPWHIAGDVKTAEDLKLPIPALAPRAEDGQQLPETVIVAPSDELKAFIRELADRAEQVRARRVDATVDNLLKITSEGRAAALDLRLVDRDTAELSKVDIAADTITRIWAEHRESMYPGPDGEPHHTRGALQIVFADLGTPTGNRWNAYDALRDALVARGVPREQVRYIHDAKSDRDKADLFAACRDGRVGVLIGSTEKMGVGTNVQARAVALHHLDCPWRPADLQQREGRILRQGNHNPQVHVLRYVTEGSFDAYSWQTVTRKAAFIAQMMRGRLDVREIEDIGDNALSYNEVKALAAGNPLLLDHAQAQAELTRLERLERNHHHGQDTLRYTIRTATRSIEGLQGRLAATEAALARRVDTRSDAFAMTIDAVRHAARPDAGQALRSTVQRQLADPRTADGRARAVGALGGFDITAAVHRDQAGHLTVTVELVDAPSGVLTLSPSEVAQQDLVIRLENRLHDLEKLHAQTQADIDRRHSEINHAQAQLDVPFRHADALATARDRIADLDAALKAQADTTPARAPGAAARHHDTAVVAQVPIDSALALDPALGQATTGWPRQPSGHDRRWLATTAADIACIHAVQGAALAGDDDVFATALDGELRSRVDSALDAGLLRRQGFWAHYLTDPHLRSALAAVCRTAVHDAIHAGAQRVGLVAAVASGARVAFARPPTIGPGHVPPAVPDASPARTPPAHHR